MTDSLQDLDVNELRRRIQAAANELHRLKHELQRRHKEQTKASNAHFTAMLRELEHPGYHDD